ncbi:nucleolar and coiled-body phosphoprotein 1 [Strongylocentrotus purpuratus]|uniref:Caspase recruitment domain-containing protein n=1 Tax=Strongylocentrotus purpuratus TaxID=7668 RepID=A0A7M7NV33_STRPU|nr:nucleolar and coiled-body phosphoprotein 1 [Strongylocentrotus purpuratus]
MCIGIMARSEDRERKRRLNGMMRDLQMVDPSEILPLLTCLSQMRKEQIRARCRNDGAMVAAAELMEELPKREGWYDILVEALREMGKTTLADQLEGPELRSSPSVPSQNVASGSSFQSAQMNPIQAKQQHSPSPPACDPQQRHPEAEASVTPDYPSRAEEKDVQRKGAKKEVNNSRVDENPGQQPPLGASLPTPQARETGGSAASSPGRDLQERHDESKSDECNTSPPPEGRSAQMQRGASGEAEELAQNMLPSNSSSAMDAGAVSVSVPPRDGSVRPRDVRLTGIEAAGGMKEDDKMKRREVGKGEEERMNIPSESEQDNHGKQNNLSPVIDSRAFNKNSDRTDCFKAPTEEEDLSGTPYTLSSTVVDPTDACDARATDPISLSEIKEGISTGNTASQSGSCLQQNDKELRSIPSVPSQNVASGSSFHSAQMNPIQAKQQQQSPSPPVSEPQQRHPEAEAFFTPGYPLKAEEKDVQRKGAEKEVNNSEVDENPGQEMRQRMPVSDPQARETRSGGSAASSPSRDLQVRHDESESDECNTSPPLEGRSAQMKRGASGKAEELAQNMLPSNSSPALDAGAVSVSVPPRDGSVRPRDGRLTGRDADRGRKEDDKMKRREVGKEEEEWRNIPSESEQDKRLHIPKPRNHPNNHDKQNNLSPTIGSRETNRNSDQTNNFKFPNDTDSIREEGRLGTGIHPLLSSGVDPRVVRVIDLIS